MNEPDARCTCGHVWNAHYESDGRGKSGCFFAYNCGCGSFTPSQEDRVSYRERIMVKAQQMWDAFDQNQKTGVRFGLFPHVAMKAAEKDGFDSHALCLALMDCAKRDGGTRA